MEFTVVIPARYGSSRLPNKVLCDLSGKTMLQRVWEQAEKSNARRIIIATDDERVESVAREFGGEVRMTKIGHQSGSDRINEIAGQLLLDDTEIIVNVQGDEPLIPPDIIIIPHYLRFFTILLFFFLLNTFGWGFLGFLKTHLSYTNVLSPAD